MAKIFALLKCAPTLVKQAVFESGTPTKPKRMPQGILFDLAEGVGFEPTWALAQTVFKAHQPVRNWRILRDDKRR